MTTPISEVIEELRRLEEAATPGPWRASEPGEAEGAYIECNVTLDEDGLVDDAKMVGRGFTGEKGKVGAFADRHFGNAALIVAMRNALPALLDHIATLTSDLATARAELTEARRMLAASDPLSGVKFPINPTEPF